MKPSLAPLKIDILTIFPNYFKTAIRLGTVRIAIEKGAMIINSVNLRDFGEKGIVDDYPYGGGAGMILKPEPIFRAVKHCGNKLATIIYLTPQGKRLVQSKVEELAKAKHLIVICGRYKGIDSRLKKVLKPLELSIGDYVLPGGEPAALVVIEAISRFLPGVLGDINSCLSDSFQTGLLDAAYFTRPRIFERLSVPKTLVSGNHSAIEDWRRKEALRNTLIKRSDLLPDSIFSKDDYLTFMEVLDGEDS